jgi:V/A-type H+/Na+-transporting ATPase subunit E
MEELRSTEILDKEIQADARKKAERILSSADQECRNVMADVTVRMAAATKDRNDAYAKKAEQFARDADAALPLEKQRYLVSFTEKAVSDAVNAYLLALSEERRFSLLELLFKRCRAVLAGKKMLASIYGCNIKTAESFLKKELGKDLVSCMETGFEKTGQQAPDGMTVHEGIILEAEDHSVRCRLTLEELISEIEDRYSRELVDALFGGRLAE